MKRIAFALTLAVASFASAAASAEKIQTKLYSTQGSPSSVAVVAGTDGVQYLFLTVSNHGASGIQIFRISNTKLDNFGLIRLGNEAAQGIVLIPHTHTLAVGASDQGIAFVDIDDALHGRSHPLYLTQGEGSGAGYLTATPDGQFLFVANEYGMYGNVGVIALHPDASGHITQPETIGHIQTPNATPGLLLSPDGTRLYVVSEAGWPDTNLKLPGADNPELLRSGCMQGGDRAMPNGILYVIDVARATALKPTGDTAADLSAGRHTVVRHMNAGCSPVRLDESADGSALYLTARGDNKIIVFDPHLLETDPTHAFLRAIPTGGTAPIGLRLFAHDTKLLVANSNRFAGGNGNAAILDLATGKVELKIDTGLFPRNITLSPDGNTLYLSNYQSNTLEAIPAGP